MNPKDLIGLTKTPLRLIPPSAMISMAEAFGDGARKYGPFNWRTTNVRWSVYYEAALRHLVLAYDGEDIDPVSRVRHLGHAMACLAIITDAESLGIVVDDRPPPGAASALIAAYAKKDDKL